MEGNLLGTLICNEQRSLSYGEWILGFLFLVSPAAFLVGICTYYLTDLKENVFFCGPLIGSVLSGLTVFAILGLPGWFFLRLGAKFGSSVGFAGGLFASVGYILVIAAPLFALLYGCSAAFGACLVSLPLTETLSLGKRAFCAGVGSSLGILFGISTAVKVLYLTSPVRLTEKRERINHVIGTNSL